MWQCFEGMKAYKDAQGKVRLFRPMMNMKRMDSSMLRLGMPSLDKEGKAGGGHRSTIYSHACTHMHVLTPSLCPYLGMTHRLLAMH